MKKPKPPQPPRCLCNSFFHWILGIVSPSKLCFTHNDKAEKYRLKIKQYELDMIRYKIEKRTCTKEEYKFFKQHKR